MIYFQPALRTTLLCLFLSLFNYGLKAQQTLNGFYVNDFKNILGNATKEEQLLEFAQSNDFNYLLLYNLRTITENSYDLSSFPSANVLANFIQKAKENYGIVAIAAIGQSFAAFKKIDAYNKLWATDDIRKIDVYHLEFEFWNPNFLATEWESTDVDAAFEYYMNQLSFVKEQALLRNAKCETYIGNITPVACAEIGTVADRVIVHYYRKSDVYNNGNSIYQYKAYRLEALAPTGDKKLEILPVFSARPHFMGPWLLEHSLEEAFTTFLYGQNGYAAQTGQWKENIEIVGYTWYRYSNLQALIGEPTPSVAVHQAVKALPKEAGQELRISQGYKEVVLIEAKTPLGKIYPQPADAYLNIELDQAIQSVMVMDLQGRQVRQGISTAQASPQTLRFDTKTWNTGMYLIYVSTVNQKQKVFKVSVQH